MKVVIDIPEFLKDRCNSTDYLLTREFVGLQKAVRDGVVIPRSCERVIDAMIEEQKSVQDSNASEDGDSN